MSHNEQIKELNAELKDLMKRYLDVLDVNSIRLTTSLTRGIHEIKIEIAGHYRA